MKHILSNCCNVTVIEEKMKYQDEETTYHFSRCSKCRKGLSSADVHRKGM